MSSGARRFNKIFAAARDDKPSPPLDMRYLKRPFTRQETSGESQRSDVVSFLHSIYESTAETLPDVRDDAFDGSSVKVELNTSDPYSASITEQVERSERQEASVQRKPRKHKRQVEINPMRTVAAGMEERYLPPSTMKDHYDQYRLQSGLAKPASFPVFWRVSQCKS